MSNPFIKKELLDAARQVAESATYQMIVAALKARTPEHPQASDLPSKQVADSFIRAGYEKALQELAEIPYQLEEDGEPEVPALLDPRD